MSNVALTQLEAEALISMEKHRTENITYDFPLLGEDVQIPLLSSDKRENFILDISRGRIDSLRIKYQTRARQVIVLVRLDIAGRPHTNPDSEEVECPHIHLYREGYDAKWAYPIPLESFKNIDNIMLTLSDFMDFCNITKKPIIQAGL